MTLSSWFLQGSLSVCLSVSLSLKQVKGKAKRQEEIFWEARLSLRFWPLKEGTVAGLNNYLVDKLLMDVQFKTIRPRRQSISTALRTILRTNFIVYEFFYLDNLTSCIKSAEQTNKQKRQWTYEKKKKRRRTLDERKKEDERTRKDAGRWRDTAGWSGTDTAGRTLGDWQTYGRILNILDGYWTYKDWNWANAQGRTLDDWNLSLPPPLCGTQGYTK